MGHDDTRSHPAPDHRTTVFRSAGRAAPHEWLAALARKRLMPRGRRPALGELSAEQWKLLEASEAGIFLSRVGNQAVQVNAAKNPAPESSFGFVDAFAAVDTKAVSSTVSLS